MQIFSFAAIVWQLMKYLDLLKILVKSRIAVQFVMVQYRKEVHISWSPRSSCFKQESHQDERELLYSADDRLLHVRGVKKIAAWMNYIFFIPQKIATSTACTYYQRESCNLGLGMYCMSYVIGRFEWKNSVGFFLFKSRQR